MRVLLISANRDPFPSPVVPLGVLAVAGSLRDEHDIRVLDLCFEQAPEEAIRATIGEFQPEVVGLGMRNLHTNAYNAAGHEELLALYDSYVAAIRGATRAPLVLGGAGYSLQPKRLLARFGADYGIVGEGERTMKHLVATLSAGGHIANPILRADSVIFDNESAVAPIRLRRSATLTSDLDLLPEPARDLVDTRYYELDGTENIQTKRGCAFQCTYCEYPDLEGRKVRVRDPERVADEILARSQVPNVRFAFLVDSVFNVPPKHALAICTALIERGSPLPWSCYGTPAAFDDQLVEAMVKAGCQGVEIGTDSGNARILKRLKKPFGLEQVLETRRLFLQHGLLDSHTFVLGAEDETADEVVETLRFVEKLDPDIALFIVFTEDREDRDPGRARHRQAILDLLAEEAPKRSGWVVPEIGVRFPKPGAALQRSPVPGPGWLGLARRRRQKALS